MAVCFPIRMLAAAALVGAAGCATPPPLERRPLPQAELDHFLAAGRDPRIYNIGIFQDPAGMRFEFANRVTSHRSARMDMISSRRLRTPVIRARTGQFIDCHLLLDTSAQHNWLLMSSISAMDYRPFAPPTGEYPDHVPSDIPGYAGMANKVVLDTLHVESPVFFVAPARGGLRPLARAAESMGGDPGTRKARRELGGRTHGVIGAALLRAFSYVRFEFDNRTVYFSTGSPYLAPDPAAIRTSLPLRYWRGRPAVQATLGGESILLVLDTAGDFDLSLPAGSDASAPLVLGDLVFDSIQLTTHDDHDLPTGFPARLGLGVLSRYTVTFDFQQGRLWLEGPPLRGGATSAHSRTDETSAPVNYQGIRP